MKHVCHHRDTEVLAQTALHAFQSNAAQFWAGQKKAKALHAMLIRSSFRHKLQAWHQWAQKQLLLKDGFTVVSVARRRTTLVAGGDQHQSLPSLIKSMPADCWHMYNHVLMV